MTKTATYVVDTNLFHECKALDANDFPWSDIGDFDEIQLVVVDTVQSELDRQKKDTRQRVKRRAVQATSWFRGMLQSPSREHVFRESGPRVNMRVSAQVPSRDHADVLDLAVDDDKIVGVASALAKADPGKNVTLLSDDTRPIAKADAIGLPFTFIPDSWKRDPEVDDAQKEIAQLKGQVAQLKSTHPELSIEAVGATNKRLAREREGYADLTVQEAEAFKTHLAATFGLDAIAAASARVVAARRSRIVLDRGMQYFEPSPQELQRYRDVDYPKWIDEALVHMSGLPAFLNGWIATEPVTINLDNTGFRPAEDVRVIFRARGNFFVAPPSEDYAPDIGRLPEAPVYPSGSFLKNGNPVGHVTHVSSVMSSLPDLAPLISRKALRDDEGWYFEPRKPEAPTIEFGYQCRKFRHAAGLEAFTVVLYPQGNEPVLSGALEVEVLASNVGQPLKALFPVEIRTTFKSPVEMLEKLLSAEKPIK